MQAQSNFLYIDANGLGHSLRIAEGKGRKGRKFDQEKIKKAESSKGVKDSLDPSTTQIPTPSPSTSLFSPSVA